METTGIEAPRRNPRVPLMGETQSPPSILSATRSSEHLPPQSTELGVDPEHCSYDSIPTIKKKENIVRALSVITEIPPSDVPPHPSQTGRHSMTLDLP